MLLLVGTTRLRRRMGKGGEVAVRVRGVRMGLISGWTMLCGARVWGLLRSEFLHLVCYLGLSVSSAGRVHDGNEWMIP